MICFLFQRNSLPELFRRSIPAVASLGGLSCVFFLLLVPATLWADLLRLKDGTVLEGKFISNTGDVTVFLTKDGEKRIPSDTIEQVEVGYSGLPLCYKTKGDSKKCGAVLHKLGPKKAVIATGDGNTERKEIPADDIIFLEFDKQSNEKAVAVLQEGANVKLKTGDQTVEGKVKKKADGSVELKTRDGTSRKLAEADITGGVVTSSPFIAGTWNYLALIPGFPQLQREQNLKGYGIMGTMGMFGAIGLVEYLQAEAVDAQAESDIGFKFFGDTTLVKKFEGHQQNQMIMGGLAAILYAYHFYDYFSYDGPSSLPKGKTSGRVSYDLMIGTRPVHAGYADATRASEETVYAASFSMRF